MTLRGTVLIILAIAWGIFGCALPIIAMVLVGEMLTGLEWVGP